jgi:hypothetical protein
MNPPSLSKEMYAAMVRLKQEGIWFARKTAYHLKVGSYNFWPNSGKIHSDGASQCDPETGLDRFMKLVKDAEARADAPASRA